VLSLPIPLRLQLAAQPELVTLVPWSTARTAVAI
jgi:hypothetical protein